jgi:hypothetical protein
MENIVSAPPLSALDLRCQIALARAICANDHDRAARIAGDAFKHFVLAIHKMAVHGGTDPTHPVAWPIRTDAVLSVAHRRSLHLVEKRAALSKQLDIAIANETLRKATRQLAIQHKLQAEPDANTLFEQLKAGKTIKLNQHSLTFDTECQGLCGTNPYGIDYYAGTMTLATVQHWRTEMLHGKTWGASPVPEWETGCEPMEDREVRELRNAIARVDDQFSALAYMKEITFAPGYSALVCAKTGKSLPSLQ